MDTVHGLAWAYARSCSEGQRQSYAVAIGVQNADLRRRQVDYHTGHMEVQHRLTRFSHHIQRLQPVIDHNLGSNGVQNALGDAWHVEQVVNGVKKAVVRAEVHQR